jgi:hypothetical protein
VQSQAGQVSGKYYRTRSLSQNLQQIFHPNRQSHSRSINNLSAVEGANYSNRVNNDGKKLINEEKLTIPHSLPQSPRIQIEPADPFFIPNQMQYSRSLNFTSSLHQTNSMLPTFKYPVKATETVTMKLKGFNLGDYRRNKFVRSTSMEVPKTLKSLNNRPSWEEREIFRENCNSRMQIDEVVKENSELLRKYCEPKIQESSSLSLWQSTFKAKLASLFKNKKKYTILEPISSGKEEAYRYNSAQSLPALASRTKTSKHKKNQKNSNLSKQITSVHGKLKTLSVNPPQMIGGSIDNLLMINRINEKDKAIGTYDTYHGRPLMSRASRLKALYKYRKPSESDDATTLSFDYDSGDVSDTSSLAQSSSELEEVLSSFSDVTTKSSNRAFKLRSSASLNSMLPQKLKYGSVHINKIESPIIKKTLSKSNIKHKTSSSRAANENSIKNKDYSKNAAFNNQMIKNYFTAGPGSSNEFPLVSHQALNHLHFLTLS